MGGFLSKCYRAEKEPPGRFTFQYLTTATGNFSQDNLIGEGAFGSLYKGLLPGRVTWYGEMIAVMKILPAAIQTSKDFLAEVRMLKRCTDCGARTIGYCDENQEQLLVYDYSEFGTLKQLFHNDEKMSINFDRRMKIALGVARGLQHLNSNKHPIIFGDFQPHNVILDQFFKPRLIGYSRARVSSSKDTKLADVLSRGDTRGYCAPEFFSTGKLTPKCDVYSYGVVLLQLLTGRHVMDDQGPPDQKHLVQWARPYFEDMNKVLQLGFRDQRMKGSFWNDYFQAVASCADRCTRDDAKDRPDLVEVVKELSLWQFQQLRKE